MRSIRSSKAGLTLRLARHLVAVAKVMSVGSVVRRRGLDWDLIQTLVTSWVTMVAEHRRSRILAMVEHCNAAALSGFLIEQGPKWCRGVEVVVSDGSKSYKTAIDQHLGSARHELDGFHVIRWFTDALTLVRRDLQRSEPAGLKPAFDPEVFRAR